MSAPDLKPFREDWLTKRANVYALISPAQAAEIIATRNTNNRRIKRRKIEMYMRDMLAGKWDPDASDIKFADDGTLLDGQNRLLAAVEADVPLPTLVRTGLNPSARDHVDTGAGRTIGDAFRMHGVTDQYNIAAAVSLRNRFDALLADGLPISRGYNVVRTLTHQEALDYLAAHPMLEKMRGVAQSVHTGVAPGIPRSVWMAFMSMIAEVDEPAARHFATRLMTGESTGTGDPLLALTRYLAHAQAPKVAGNRDRNSAMRHLVAMVKTWNAWRRDEKVTAVTTAETEKVTDPLV